MNATLLSSKILHFGWQKPYSNVPSSSKKGAQQLVE